ncbi:AGAP009277-PA-like protein [Anopheles sinensis]|uniref:AGAP009277-PA-like protein n=1 Tax=Anopheles sinensis TaxID=74873 RepID=A0A084VWG9_ANOSI|nr:AGAP009277-PA-like protein [Anopheles sinensis]
MQDFFVTLEQYSWLTRITVATDLLNIPQRYDSSLVSRLSSCLEALELGSFNFSPLVINNITKHLIEDLPLQGVNLLYVIKKLAITNSKILYYVAVSLVFVGIEAITGASKSRYRLHTVDEFLKYLEVLNIEHLHSERHNLQIIYQLLKLLSLYENMVLVRHFGKQHADLESEHKCYANFFRVSDQQRMAFQLWLEKSSSLVRLSGNDRDVDYLILADLIEVDMLPLLDDVNPTEDLL